MTIRILYNYLLTILGIREILPREIIHSKSIIECNETMVRLSPTVGLFVKGQDTFCRRSVAEKLYRVAQTLHKKGFGLYVYEAYRSPEEQKARMEKTIRFYEDSPLDQREKEMMIRRSTAGVGGGHQTGGAIDLTLCDKDGTILDMGSEYPVKCPEMTTSYRISPPITSRRKMLCNAMKKEGFANYPAEWWHFSYGDQMWAAYRHRRHAIYGVIEFTR